MDTDALPDQISPNSTVFSGKAWSNGRAGYGIKINPNDRDKFFDRKWRAVCLQLPTGDVATPNIDKDSFWNATCRELIDAKIGRWFLSKSLAPWPPGRPPAIKLTSIGHGVFDVTEAS